MSNVFVTNILIEVWGEVFWWYYHIYWKLRMYSRCLRLTKKFRNWQYIYLPLIIVVHVKYILHNCLQCVLLHAQPRWVSEVIITPNSVKMMVTCQTVPICLELWRWQTASWSHPWTTFCWGPSLMTSSWFWCWQSRGEGWSSCCCCWDWTHWWTEHSPPTTQVWWLLLLCQNWFMMC